MRNHVPTPFVVRLTALSRAAEALRADLLGVCCELPEDDAGRAEIAGHARELANHARKVLERAERLARVLG